MLKRVAVLSLLLMYLGTTVGFAMSVHFCGTKISRVRINYKSEKSCCVKETGSNADECCKDKQINIKLSDQQQFIQSAKIPAVVNFDLLVFPSWISNSFSETSASVSRSPYRGPPVISNVPFSIQNCTFRI
jgi:hypothetical protein